MSRYIDADALDRAFSKLRFNNDGELEHYGDRPNWYLWGSEVENLIADAPTIDIVRCKECRWYDHICWRIEASEREFMADDFCSYGEKKGADDIDEAPTIEPKRGEWIEFDTKWGRSLYYCTNCMETTEVPTAFGKPLYDFCPNCGADMREREGE